MCVLGQSEPIGSVLTFPSGYDTLEYSWVKATAVSARLRILFVTLQNTNKGVGAGIQGIFLHNKTLGVAFCFLLSSEAASTEVGGIQYHVL